MRSPLEYSMITSNDSSDHLGPAWPLRAGGGGVLMGLANLVPGISGGTMLLAAGVYPAFINAVAEVTTLKFRPRSLGLLGCVIGTAMIAFFALAGPVKDLVVHHRWIMYSLFIGLTLGGVPILLKLIGRKTTGMWVGCAIGIVVMIGLALAQSAGTGSADRSGFLFMFLAGAAGASAMILPGVSGGYLLLVLGVYVSILSAIARFKDALPGVGSGDTDTLMEVGLGVILPAGLGVVVGIAVVSNVLKWLLKRYEKPTLGVLLGLLLGAVVGIWPFQAGVRPEPGDMLKGQKISVTTGLEGELIYAETGRPVEQEDWKTAYFGPGFGQAAGSLGLVLAGFAIASGIGKLGNTAKSDPAGR